VAVVSNNYEGRRDYDANKYSDKKASSDLSFERSSFERKRRVSDLKKILADVEGRRWIYGLLERCYVFHSVMTGNSYTYFNEGMRNVGLMIMDELSQVGPEVYGELHRESFSWLPEVLKEVKKED
jgi:hypothetical protein